MKNKLNDHLPVNILKEGSVEVVNIANNHMHDYLEAGYKDTIKNLQKAGIKYFGSDVFESTNPHIGYLNYEFKLIEIVKGLRIGLLGYKVWRNSGSITCKGGTRLSLIEYRLLIFIVLFHHESCFA